MVCARSVYAPDTQIRQGEVEALCQPVEALRDSLEKQEVSFYSMLCPSFKRQESLQSTTFSWIASGKGPYCPDVRAIWTRIGNMTTFGPSTSACSHQPLKKLHRSPSEVTLAESTSSLEEVRTVSFRLLDNETNPIPIPVKKKFRNRGLAWSCRFFHKQSVVALGEWVIRFVGLLTIEKKT